MSSAIEFSGVVKIYRRRMSGTTTVALEGVSFEVAAGEICAFLGPNGAGKTTSMNILMGFAPADAGEVSVLGYPPGDVRAKQSIGFVPENFAFYRFLTGEQLLRLHADLAGLDRATAAGRIPALLAQVQLTGHEHQKIGQYSRGMVQRIGIAQALLSTPKLMVLDEPTSGLDPAGRRDVRDLLLTLKAAGTTVLLSSHLLAEVEQVCDRVIILDRGRLVRTGKMDDLLNLGRRVEIVTDRLPEGVDQELIARGAAVERDVHGWRITADIALKREIAEMLWTVGCDVVSIQPLKNSLEGVFLQMVGRPEEAS